MNLYLVTIDVPAEPRFGAASFDVEAESVAAAEAEGLARVQARWACGAPFRVVARDWVEIKADLARDRADG